MSITISAFGQTTDGRAVQRITMQNKNGTAVSVLDYGATIQSLCFGGVDIVLGYDTMEGYQQYSGYLGATVGRMANRIAKGRFMLEGREIVVACNEADRGNHLHGGMVGFDKRIWSVKVVSDGDEPAVRFGLVSEDGEEGYPGRLDVTVTFSLRADDTLELAYRAETDNTTVVSMTNHTYFNLNGCDGQTVDNTVLQVFANEFTAVDENLIPTGDFVCVRGTPLDFRQPRPLSEVFACIDPLVAGVCGIDHNFVLAHDRRDLSEAAVAYSPSTGIRLTCLTDLPGIQIYTGNFLNGNVGKKGVRYSQHHGFCMETQFFPDSVNHENFPSVVLRPGEVYASVTQFKLQKD